MVSRRVVVSGVVLLALVGCGRKGPLEPPAGTAVVKPVAEPEKPDSQFSPGPLKGRKKRIPIVPPKDDFILDPII